MVTYAIVVDGPAYAAALAIKFSRSTAELMTPNCMLGPDEIIVTDLQVVSTETAPNVWLRDESWPADQRKHPTSPFQRGGGR